jgi:hypothetical protein
MVHFMRPTDRADIFIVAPGEPLESLVNDYVVNKKICKAVSHYSKSDCLEPVDMLKCTEQYAQKTWDSEDEKECIIFLKQMVMWLMMIFMEIP